jgi:hypothetical protein
MIQPCHIACKHPINLFIHRMLQERVMPTYKAVTPLVAFDGFTNSGNFRFVAPKQLMMLNGLEYNDEDFIEYMEQPLSSVVQQSSGITLQLNEGTGALSAVTYFETAQELDEQHITQLKSYYDGQMSDGIGENLLGELQRRADVEFRLAVYWLYDENMGSHLDRVT